MKTVDQLINEAIEREGDYSHHPADRGGPTRFGVTEQVARANGYAGDMRSFPRDRAVAIYRATYWTRPGINMGVIVAGGFLQRALNALNRGAVDYPDLLVDGQVGPVTIFALRQFLAKRGSRGEIVLVKALDALQGERYLHLAEIRPANEAFVFGWLSERLGQAL